MKLKKSLNQSRSSISNIVKNQLCQGCGLCYLIYPKEIDFSDKGNFNKPICNNSNKICPSLQFSKPKKEPNTKNNIFFGNYKNLYLAKSSNLKILKNASSGGFITQLIIYLLKNKIINGAIVTTNSDKNPLENQIKVITNFKDLENNPLESRYSPASPLLGIKNLTNIKGKYIFVGKGCDITALNKLIKIDKNLAQKIFLKIGIFCAHQPSRQATLDLIQKQNVKINQIEKIKYRFGRWPGNFSIKLKNKEIKIPYQIAWAKNLALEKYKNPRCILCPDGFNEASDFSVGDPWIYLNSNKNGSIVISRTQNSQKIISLIKNSEDFKIEKINSKIIIKSQLSLVQKKKKILPRLLLLKKLSKIQITYHGWNLEKIWVKNSLVEKTKYILIASVLYLKYFLKPSRVPKK